ncbi:hypothetical protein Val02_21920 [Virgisporangium aliadipatigenens]|uniref:Uncharacterized protein n=1 Tax=Virgisporangium aliadipatigenens TaxID=741659 RepID=A0A8J3YJY2_9ACTN|nr:hypothetical protein [Virgisporangium aliadipatigenens]GIJ45306.1 hypothetical protein Val02_21920 [Virgisporangium aliadipatigenens]
MYPEENRPTGPFEPASDLDASSARIAAEASVQAGGTAFGIKLSDNGLAVGWLGRNSSDWAVLADSPQPLEPYIYDGKTYFKIPGEAKYMSISNNAYVGFYKWAGATVFHQEGEYLVSDHNGQKLSMYSTDNAYLYCWDKYTVLEAQLVTR